MGGKLFKSNFQKIAEEIERRYSRIGFNHVKTDEWLNLIAHIGKPLKNIKFLGSGGEGWTLSGHEEGFTHREIVVKVFRPSFLQDPLAPERIERTVTIQDKLNLELKKSKVPRVISHSKDAWCCYMISDKIDGKTLFDATRDFDREQIVKTYLRVCDAVDEFHRKLVVHRDLKPENIILTPSNEIAFFDWGSSFEMLSAQTLTCTGFNLSSAKYGSEEQLAGMAHHCDTRSDIQSLCYILCSLVTGKEAECYWSENDNRWYVGDRYERYLPESLYNVFMKGASTDKTERHQNVTLLMEAVKLAAIQDGLITDEDLLKKTARIEEFRRTQRPTRQESNNNSYREYERRELESWTEAIKRVKERMQNGDI